MNTARLLSMLEKSHYPFKSYPRGTCETILFPGCSFPSQFPRTMDALSDCCLRHRVGIVYDCCGLPLEGFGESTRAKKILIRLQKRLDELSCKRIAFACPNCQAYLGPRLEVESVSVYDLLAQWGEVSPEPLPEGYLFIPCPDRKDRQTETRIRQVCDMSNVSTLEGASCCGLNPQLVARNPEASMHMGRQIVRKLANARLYTYCASCSGQFSRLGCTSCQHVLSHILGVQESPDSQHALINRAKRKFDRNVTPIAQQEQA